MGMKVIVYGDPDLHDYAYIHSVLYEINEKLPITELVHMGVRGVDYCSGQWGHQNNVEVVNLGGLGGEWAENMMIGLNSDAQYLICFGDGHEMQRVSQQAKYAGIDVIKIPIFG